jgi:hypothetical protein
MRRSILPGALCAVMLAATNARAADPTKRECIDANVQGQSLQKGGKLREAEATLRACASPACPPAVRDDCAQRLDELDRVMPTLVFEATDPAGKDLTAVRVTVDGEPLADVLDGTALAVDPGEHTFTFEVAGESPVNLKLVIREGDRGRRARVTLGVAQSVTTTPVAAPPVAPHPITPVAPPITSTEGPPGSPTTGNAQRIAGVVVGATGIVGLAPMRHS